MAKAITVQKFFLLNPAKMEDLSLSPNELTDDEFIFESERQRKDYQFYPFEELFNKQTNLSEKYYLRIRKAELRLI